MIKNHSHCAIHRAIAGLYHDEMIYSNRTVGPYGEMIPRSHMEMKRWADVFYGHAQTILYFATLACLGEARYLLECGTVCNYSTIMHSNFLRIPHGVRLLESPLKQRKSRITPGILPMGWTGQIVNQHGYRHFGALHVSYSGKDQRYPLLMDILRESLPESYVCGFINCGDHRGTLRSNCYSFSIPREAYLPLLDLCHFCFSHGEWREGYGGSKWALCAQTALNLSRVIAEEAPIPLLILASDRVINAVHNGGNLLNKFNTCGLSMEQLLSDHANGYVHRLKRIKEFTCVNQKEKQASWEKETFGLCYRANTERKISPRWIENIPNVQNLRTSPDGRPRRTTLLDLVEV